VQLDSDFKAKMLQIPRPHQGGYSAPQPTLLDLRGLLLREVEKVR